MSDKSRREFASIIFQDIVAGMQQHARPASAGSTRASEKANRANAHLAEHAMERLSIPLRDSALDTLSALGPFQAGGRSAHFVQGLLAGLESVESMEERWDGVIQGLWQGGLNALRSAYPELPTAVLTLELVRDLTSAYWGGIREELRGGAPPPLLRLHGVELFEGLLTWAVREARRSTAWSGLEHDRRRAATAAYASGVSELLSVSADDWLFAPLEMVLQTPLQGRFLKALARVSFAFPAFCTPSSEKEEWWFQAALADLARPEKEDKFLPPLLIAEAVIALAESGLRDFPLLTRNPTSRHLFVVGAYRSLVELLSTPAREDQKLPLAEQLGPEERWELFQAVADAWTSRPDWLFRKPAQQERAATLLPVLVEALSQLGPGYVKALLRHGKLSALLTSVMMSGLCGRLSSLNGRRIASILGPVLNELVATGLSGWGRLLEEGRVTDLLTAIAGSKLADKLFGEDEETVTQAARAIGVVAVELRAGRLFSVPEMTERLNKGK